MKKIHYIIAASLLAMPALAQETYENARLTSSDLNGTARYVGMGGAMEALGADISTISSNPAGLGLFRHHNISIGAGFVSENFLFGNTTNPSFDQLGGVYAMKNHKNGSINFGFNYHKSKNFNFILNASNRLENSSQNKQSYIKGLLGEQSNGGFAIDKTKDGLYNGYVNNDPNNNATALTWSQLDYLYWNTVIPDSKDGKYYTYDAEYFMFERNNSGYIANYDFNISGSVKNNFYWGLTIGVKDVNYSNHSLYREDMAKNMGYIEVQDDRKITGTGFDITAGVIFRPVKTSPFRIGAYVKTPTYYDLTTTNFTQIKNKTKEGGTFDNGKINNSYSYKLWTPWKMGLSLGHTVGRNLALGLTYEYEDHSSTSSRVIDETFVDYYSGEIYESSSKDRAVNKHTEMALKGVSTLKIGAEYKPTDKLSLRAGYNYVSSKYNPLAQKDPSIVSFGNHYSSTTDYTNWKDINRFTLGVGYQIQKFTIDLAYQYSTQKGDFYPFSNMAVQVVDPSNGQKIEYTNTTKATEVTQDRHQLLLTLGYRF